MASSVKAAHAQSMGYLLVAGWRPAVKSRGEDVLYWHRHLVRLGHLSACSSLLECFILTWLLLETSLSSACVGGYSPSQGGGGVIRSLLATRTLLKSTASILAKTFRYMSNAPQHPFINYFPSLVAHSHFDLASISGFVYCKTISF